LDISLPLAEMAKRRILVAGLVARHTTAEEIAGWCGAVLRSAMPRKPLAPSEPAGYRWWEKASCEVILCLGFPEGP
jgi:hypothetical protein